MYILGVCVVYAVHRTYSTAHVQCRCMCVIRRTHVQCTLYSVQCIRRTSYSVQCIRRTSYSVQCIHRTSYSVQCIRRTSYSVQCIHRTSYSVRVLYAVHSTYSITHVQYMCMWVAAILGVMCIHWCLYVCVFAC